MKEIVRNIENNDEKEELSEINKNNLDYTTHLYFPEHRLVIEVDEFNHVDIIGNNDREEEIKEYLTSKFIKSNPDIDN